MTEARRRKVSKRKLRKLDRNTRERERERERERGEREREREREERENKREDGEKERKGRRKREERERWGEEEISFREEKKNTFLRPNKSQSIHKLKSLLHSLKKTFCDPELFQYFENQLSTL